MCWHSRLNIPISLKSAKLTQTLFCPKIYIYTFWCLEPHVCLLLQSLQVWTTYKNTRKIWNDWLLAHLTATFSIDKQCGDLPCYVLFLGLFHNIIGFSCIGKGWNSFPLWKSKTVLWFPKHHQNPSTQLRAESLREFDVLLWSNAKVPRYLLQ